ncbi:DUF1211 domain-containing protein [Deinococcus psychrotolerans]|uniref:DUF1211 domain-containing protein n=2 Tax=Deinococcus psychrotolerans TaxID=2489213 RepID=A0A3G8YFQ4_9DEIO|nr:DUF1211 domain-containing protein [Deinococcus psychrotolerans]
MGKTRLEAFSDGVLAIIITIMVLELKPPEGHELSDLFRDWPKFLAYVVSFIYVGIYWNNHHHMLHTVKRINGNVMWANLHLLFWLSLLPFMTAWAGETHFSAVPMSIYALDLLICGLAYVILQYRIINADSSNGLLLRAIGNDSKGKISTALYLIAVVVPFFGFFGTVLSGIIIIGNTLLWVIPDRRIERVLAEEEAKPMT